MSTEIGRAHYSVDQSWPRYPPRSITIWGYAECRVPQRLIGEKIRHSDENGPPLPGIARSPDHIGQSVVEDVPHRSTCLTLPGSTRRRVVAVICAVFAGAAALIVFYLALAVVAKVLGGTEPMQVGQEPAPAGIETIATVLPLGLTMVGIEVVTTANSRLRSAARPMGLALAAGMACTAWVWTADQVGTTGGFS